MAAAEVRRCRRAAGGHADAAERTGERASGAGICLCRAAGRREDHHGAHSRAGIELPERPDARSVRDLRCLCRDCRRARHRRPRDRRGHAHRHRQRPRGDRLRTRDRASPQPLQDLHHRRGPSAVDSIVQRAVEIDRGAAAARGLHDGDDRAREDSRDGPVPLAGLRVPHDRHEGDRRPAPADRRCRRHSGRGRVAAAHRSRWRRQHARRAEQARSGHRVHRENDRQRRCGDGARARRPRSRARHDSGRRR